MEHGPLLACPCSLTPWRGSAMEPAWAAASVTVASKRRVAHHAIHQTASVSSANVVTILDLVLVNLYCKVSFLVLLSISVRVDSVHAMAPKISDDKVTQTIVKAVREIWKNDRDQLTVNYARQVAEKKLGLEEGFLKEDDWKAKSKQLILEEVVCKPGLVTSSL